MLTGAVVAMTATIALGVSWTTYEVLEGYRTRAAVTQAVYEVPGEPVLVTARTLGVGTVISEEDLTTRKVGPDYVPVTALIEPEEAVGRVVRERLLEGDFVREERLSRSGSGDGLEAILADGMRAIALNLVDDDVVSGFIEPGNHVDLVATLPAEDAAEAETRMLLQAVRVLAVDERISETAAGDPVRQSQVTLAVTAADAERTAHVLAVARPKLLLRSDIDVTHLETHGATSTSLLGTPRTRMTTTEFRERVDDATIDRWVELVWGSEKSREPVIDPRLVEVEGFEDD